MITTSAAHGQALTLDALIESGVATSGWPRARADETFVYQFSSGSTGRPKRVPRTHGQCAAEAELYASLGDRPPRTRSSARCRSSTPTGWAPACSRPRRLRRDAGDPRGPEPVPAQAPPRAGADRAGAGDDLPRRAVQLPADGRGAGRAPTCPRCGSASPPAPRCRAEPSRPSASASACSSASSTARTETGMIAANIDADPVATFESVGAPVGDVESRSSTTTGAPVPAGEVGEVTVASPARPPATRTWRTLNRDRLPRRPLLHRRPRAPRRGRDGCTSTGRKKLLIEVGGYKVDPIEVEDVRRRAPEGRRGGRRRRPGRDRGRGGRQGRRRAERATATSAS